jgi:uncharacterized protein with NRDE domain
MCLIVFAWQEGPDRLVVAANRDEFHARPAEPAGFWPDAPHVLAGRDVRGGGTWMGITHSGRFAAVTNFRDTAPPPAGAPSRGHLVSGFLTGAEPAAEYARRAEDEGGRYAGFNLLVGDSSGLFYASNRGGGRRVLEPGVYGLSNHLLDTPWPKVRRTKEALRAALDRSAAAREAALFAALADERFAPDGDLPATGVGIERERALSAAFIRAGTYGTRASTVLTVGGDGRVRFVERTVVPDAGFGAEAAFEFEVAAPAALHR